MLIEIIEILTKATGAGIYTCLWKKISSSNWIAASGDKFTEYIIGPWQDEHLYEVDDLAKGSNGKIYRCTYYHLSSPEYKPITGEYWEGYWVAAKTMDDPWQEGIDYYIGDFTPGTDSQVYRCISPHLSSSDNRPVSGLPEVWPLYWVLVETVEVFNLAENYTISSPAPALAAGDRLYCWQMPDDEDVPRWVGIPVTPALRLAVAKEGAGANQYISCNLVANDGVSEIESGLGSDIQVYFKANNAEETPDWRLDEIVPQLKSGDCLVSVTNISGKWYFGNVVAQGETKEV